MESTAPPLVWAAVKVVHYVYPFMVLFYFLIAGIIKTCSLEAVKLKDGNRQFRRDVLISLMLLITTTYTAEAIDIGIYDAILRRFDTSQDYNICVLTSILVWAVLLLNLAETQNPVWFQYIGCWLIGIVSETFLVIVYNIIHPPRIWFEYVSIVLQVSRVCAFVMLLMLYLELRIRKEGEDPEQQSLFRRALGGTTDSGYGTAEEQTPLLADNDDDDLTEALEQQKARERRAARLAKKGSWFTYAKSFWVFFPLIWPVNNKKLQAHILGVFGCLLFSNLMTLIIPIQFGIMGSALIGSADTSQGPWQAIGIYAALSMASSGSFIGALQDMLWLPIQIYAREMICTVSYKHVMNLSSDFHDSKSTSEIMHVLVQGRSIGDLLDTVLFQILPVFIDLFVASIYLYTLFGPYMVLIAFAQIVVYVCATSRMLNMILPLRRMFLKWLNKESVTRSEGLGGWQNAVHFNNIPYEHQRYSGAVGNLNAAEYTYYATYELTSVTQGLILGVSLTLALFTGAYQVLVLKTRSVGDFITLVSYWRTLSSPLWTFAMLYKSISNQILDAEALLELFETKPTVFDSPDAKPLEFLRGSVTFEGVGFTFDERKSTLNDVSFHVPGGSSVALVGETGGGKSTILKLLSRFYDVQAGAIKIDGQDVRDVTLDSLRESIGSVPQDPRLFNDTILSNVRYAKLDASDDEIYEACKAAVIHEKIMSFPNGYKSKVGDNGVKLSGGERQRIAIARALLKNPKIIVLDEATSAVDTETESQIQEALAKLCGGRTTLIVAHRLSTIMKADRILVVKEGAIIEEGSHDVLLKKCGKYYDLWSKQIFVKPLNDPEQLQSPSKPLANIVNDVDPSRETVQLSKALKTTDLAHKENSEGKKLKADAPEFVPRGACSGDNGAADTQQEDGQGSKENVMRKSFANIARQASKKAGKQIARTFESGGSSGDISQSSATQNEDKDDEGNLSGTAKILKRTRSSRRRQSKSEPPAQGTAGQAHDSTRRATDGSQETEYTGSGSGDGSLPLASTSERRASAPSDPPSGTIRDMRAASRRRRSRRPKHWRLRKHSHDRSLSTNLSSSTSGSAGYGSVTDIEVAPVTTACEVPPLIAPRIRFAPGC